MLWDSLPLRLELLATGDMQPVVFWLMLGFIFISFSFFGTYHSRYRGVFFLEVFPKWLERPLISFIFPVQDFLDNCQKFKGRGDIYHVSHGIVSGIAHNWLDLEHTKPCLTLDLWLSHRIPNFGRVGRVATSVWEPSFKDTELPMAGVQTRCSVFTQICLHLARSSDYLQQSGTCSFADLPSGCF